MILPLLAAEMVFSLLVLIRVFLFVNLNNSTVQVFSFPFCRGLQQDAELSLRLPCSFRVVPDKRALSFLESSDLFS